MKTADDILDTALLEILCCPVSHQSLRLADGADLAAASAKAGAEVAGALVREDGRMLYPIRNGIPLLIPEEGITL